MTPAIPPSLVLHPAPDAPRAPLLDGVELRELGVLIDGPKNVVFLITATRTTEFSRVYYFDGQYSVGREGPKVGDTILTYAEIDQEYMRLGFKDGHRMLVPRSWLQISYLPA